MSDAMSKSSVEDSEERSESLLIDGERIRDDTSPGSAASNAAQSSPTQSTQHIPAQKRRRVTRACDECRRKKIKCDGKQPCTHCTVYSYDCTYDQPSHRRRNPGPQYLEAVEQRLHRAEAVLRLVAPNIDLNDPNLNSMIQQGYIPNQRQGQGQISFDAAKTQSSRSSIPELDEPAAEANLESMIRATGQLELDSRGYWDYHGNSSGLNFIRGVRDQIGELSSPDQEESTTHYVKASTTDDSKYASAEAKLQAEVASELGSTGTEELPSRQVAEEFCSYALDDATTVLICVHQPSFYQALARIYDLHPDQYENQDHKFLPLLYTVLALGCLFAKDGTSNLEVKGYESATDQGYKYFWAARQLIDMADCRDLLSIQAVVFMILFLQCSAKLSTCYAYIGVALRSALRMGLHRSFNNSFTPIESETRKRVFWVIRKMDIHVGAMLGLPQTLSDDDIDQDYPTETEDDCITEETILPMAPGTTAMTAAANANFRLNLVISKIVRNIYPIKGFSSRQQDHSRTYSVSYNTIRDIEGDLQRWMENLPLAFQPGRGGSPRIQRAQQLLRMSFAHAQFMLYRPFLHYVADSSPSKPVDPRSYACAAACVGVSRNTIHITSEMNKRGLLVGSYWFVMYTTFFGILSLVFFAIENPESASSQDVMQDAKEGKKTLAALAKRSMAADRCSSTLTTLFEYYYKILQSRKSQPKNARPSVDSTTQSDSTSTASVEGVKRASTFPKSNPPVATNPRRPRGTKRATHPITAPPQTQAGGPSRRIPQSPVAVESPGGAAVPYGLQGSFSNQQHYQEHRQFGPQQPGGHLPHPHRYPEHQNEGKLSDFSSIMFPSTDPFDYPNQMMTTLEQSKARDSKGDTFHPAAYGQEFGGPSSSGPPGVLPSNDQIDIQLFGPLPPYMHMPQPHPRMGGFRSTTGVQAAGQQPQQVTPGVDNSNANSSNVGAWNQHARSAGLPGMNLDEIFGGEEWKGFNPDQF